jgi:hypothetical protein
VTTLAARRRGRRPSLPGFLRPPPVVPVPLPPKHPADILALPQPDWLGQTVTFAGPATLIAALKRAAAGSGLVPWIYDYDRREETFFLWLATPKGGRRGLSIPAAHHLARQLREAEWLLHETAAAQAGRAGGTVPFDLHALVPVPGAILRLGPEDPAGLRWLWQHWGTTWTLRRVETVRDEAGYFAVRFYSADWTPWPVLRHIQTQWPALTFEVRVDYG